MTADKADALKEDAVKWNSIDWKETELQVRRLQARIAKAVKDNRWNKVKVLQYLLTHSLYAKLLAVKRVTSNQVRCNQEVTQPGRPTGVAFRDARAVCGESRMHGSKGAWGWQQPPATRWPASKTDRNGTSLAYTPTPRGMPGITTYPDSSQVINTCDNLDRLSGVTDSLGNSSYTYDGAGRITGYTDAQGFTLSFDYDPAGNLAHVTYPDQTVVAYAYDNANRLTTVTWDTQQATYGYGETTGRLETFTHFNGIETAYSYDGAGRLTGITSNVSSYAFTLDANGNRVQSTQSEPLSPAFSPEETSYEYNTQRNRLLSAGDLNYTYDDEGRLQAAGSASYTFDCDNRLIGIDTAQFFYDGRGNRLKAIRGGVTTFYIYDPWGNLLAEADSNGITRKYIYGKGLLAMATSSDMYCYHFDATGNTIALTDMAQTVVNSYVYEPFGQVLAQQETVAQPFKFVGRFGVMAEQNGLYYMRARYYDPNVGRFISEDPLGFGGGDVNLLAYVRNNPVNAIDPLGLAAPCAEEDCAMVPIDRPIVGGSGHGGGEPVLPAPGGGVVDPAGSIEALPPIKSGSADGLTAGRPFPQGVKDAAKAENPTATCVYCGREGTATQVDHAIPKACRGNATLDNAQLACPHCNASKGAGDFPKTPPRGYTGPWPW